MEESQINAVLAAVADQRNSAQNEVAVKHAALVVALQDVEGLNKIIADNSQQAIDIRVEWAEEVDNLTEMLEWSDERGAGYVDTIGGKDAEIAQLKAKLEDLRVTPIDSAEMTEVKAANASLHKMVRGLRADLKKAQCFANGDPKD